MQAHPVYGCAAYAMGAINEPPAETTPTFEIRQLSLRLAAVELQVCRVCCASEFGIAATAM